MLAAKFTIFLLRPQHFVVNCGDLKNHSSRTLFPMKSSLIFKLFVVASCMMLNLAPCLALTTDKAPAEQAKIDAAIAKVYPALVRIHVVATRPSSGRMEKYGGTGSGTIIHKDGYVVTNHHVAGKGSRIWCRLADKTRVDAELIGTDPQTDLCIIKLNMDQVPDRLKPLPIGKFGNVDSIEVGDTVLAMGSPAGVSQSVTVGVVANMEMITPGNTGSMKQDGERVGDLVRWIGHDAVIYFGNSGGPLVNLDGQIIGVNEIGLGSLGGAIPADIARHVVDELIEHQTVERSWTGIYTQPLLKSFNEDVKGVLVSSVQEDSPGSKTDIQPGDVITAFDGVPVDVRTPEHIPLFNRIVLGTPVGKEVEVSLLRDGSPRVVTLTTEIRSKARGTDTELKSWGVTAQDLTTRSAIAMRRENADGVLISSVSPAGPAADAKPPVRVGDVILKIDGTPIRTIADLLSVSEKLASSDDEVKALVEFERGKSLIATVVEIGKEPNASRSSAAQKAWIGLSTQVLTRKLAEVVGLKGKKGVRVVNILPGCQAEEAGFEKGDILLKIDGQVIQAEREKDKNVFKNMIRDYPIDETAEFEVVRNGDKMKIKCILEPAPQSTSEFEIYNDEVLEFSARELSQTRSKEIEAETGVYVEKVERAGWATLAGLTGGDIIKEINDTPITSLETLEEILTGIKDRQDEFVVVLVNRNSRTLYIEIHPVWSEPGVPAS